MTPDRRSCCTLSPPSHPCMTAEAALRRKNLAYERIDLVAGRAPRGDGAPVRQRPRDGAGPAARHRARARVAGDPRAARGARAGPAAVPGRRSPRRCARPSAGATRSCRTSARRLPWGALHFRPESMGSFGGAGPLDPAGTDYAIRYVRGSWKYHGITCRQLADDLAGAAREARARRRAGGRRHRRRRDADRGRPADRRDAAGAARARRPAAADRGPARRSALARRWFPDYAGRRARRRLPGRLGTRRLTAPRRGHDPRPAARRERHVAPRHALGARLPPSAARTGATIVRSTTRISISANEAPRQRRTPPPYGIHA